MSANFTPDFKPLKDSSPFRVWCQKVLPLVYDDSLSYYEVLCKLVTYLNNLIENENNQNENIEDLMKAYKELEGYVNSYFDDLDVQNEINNKLDEMYSEGLFDKYFPKKRVILCVGDSYGVINGGWVQPLQNVMPECVVKNLCVSSSGFTLSPLSFLSQLQEYSGDTWEVTDILVGGGLNDCLTTNLLPEKMREFTAYAKQKFHNAVLWCSYFGKDISNRSGRTTQAWINTYKIYNDFATQYGFDKNIPGILSVLTKGQSDFTDGIHPNQKALQTIANLLAVGLRGGTPCYTDFYNVSDAHSDLTFSVSGEFITIFFSSITRTCPDAMTKPLTNYFDITLQTSDQYYAEYDGVSCFCLLSFENATNYTKPIPCGIRIIQNTLRIFNIEPLTETITPQAGSQYYINRRTHVSCCVPCSFVG